MPAWSRAETGVGVSMTSISQLWVGNWADLRMAATAMRSAEASTKAGVPAPWGSARRPLKMASRLPVPNCGYSRVTAPIRQASPRRAAMNFLRAATTARRRSR
jgi:hypothetical protein